jgi:cobalt/nickel transport system permease protein
MDRWSRQASFLHDRDARAKVVVLVLFLILLATARPDAWFTIGIDAAVLGAGIVTAGLPVVSLLLRAMIVLPFSLTFGVLSWAAGDHLRAVGLVEKSYLSTLAALLVIATTPLPVLLRGLDSLGAPRLVVLVAQFIYRYLFVLSEQAQHMRLAAQSRQGDGSRRHRRLGFRAASGALAALFARAYYRAEGIHQAMLARGFAGRFTPLAASRFRPADGAFALGISGLLILARFQ